MRYISLFSGIEACSVGWKDLNWQPVAFADFDEFPSAVLKHHYPEVPNAGDVLKHDWTQYKGKCELIVGGSPCQSFSHAGKRLGMDDPRGNLALHYLRIVRNIQPRWFIYENVPGLLSSNEGEDFASFLGEVAKLGYGFAYRVLDAQFYGVPQRRRRVFVVGHIGDWRRAAAVLFERESLSGHPAPSRKAREEIAGTIAACSFSGGAGGRPDGAAVNNFVPELSNALCARDYKGARPEADQGAPVIAFGAAPLNTQLGLRGPDNVGSLCARTGRSISVQDAEQAHLLPIAFGAQNSAAQGDSVSTDLTPKLDKSKTPAVAFEKKNQVGEVREGDVANTLNTNFNASGRNTPMLRQASAVRRLTPRECERLQGFGDNYTQIPWRNKPAESCPDGPRYKAMGNSMAVPVMRWIGERIKMVEEITNTAA